MAHGFNSALLSSPWPTLRAGGAGFVRFRLSARGAEANRSWPVDGARQGDQQDLQVRTLCHGLFGGMNVTQLSAEDSVKLWETVDFSEVIEIG